MASQRYIKIPEGEAFNYVTPLSISDVNPDISIEYHKFMKQSADLYQKMILDGVPKEDARFVLPNACETSLVLTMNARELLHFFTMRCCERAQWEIREMSIGMLKLVKPKIPCVFENAGPNCVSNKCKEGKLSCGRPTEIKELFKRM